MKILITEVTEMHSSNYCVAGWSVEHRRVIRPLPNGANWTHPLLAANGIEPGAFIEARESGVLPLGSFPHRTEDLPIVPASLRQVPAGGPIRWLGADAPASSPTLSDAFEGHLRHNRIWNGCRNGIYVPMGTRTRSLYGVVIARRGLRFFENGKLRVYMDDGEARYNLAVSSHALRKVFRAGGIAAVADALPHDGALHVRVGLARAWGDQPDKCYVMINGVLW